MIHEPRPHAEVEGGGVRCSCGEDFTIGRPAPDTSSRKPSRKQLSTMAHCWEAYRAHWSACQSDRLAG